MEDTEGELKYHGIYDGVVVENQDPLLLGRVRVMIPGLIEPRSDWAYQIGGGTSESEGNWWVPAVNANVAVYFREGDLEHPRYFLGSWRAPNDTPESPTFVRALSPSEAVQVAGLQTRRWEIVFDNRNGQENLIIRDRANPDNAIAFDGIQQTVEISGTVAVNIRSVGIVNIEALQVVINGRLVAPTGGTI